MFQQTRTNTLDTASAVAEILYRQYSRGETRLAELAEGYEAEMAESDRRWEETNGSFAHPWAETSSYTIPMDRAEDYLGEMRVELGVRGPWNVGTWGEGALKFLEKVRQEKIDSSLGEGI